jgi:hypothetical protein
MMDRDAERFDRADETLQGDTGMIGSESEEPGPGRDTSLTDPDPAAASADQPRGTVAMSEGDPMATRLGSHVEGAGVIGYDVAAAEERAAPPVPEHPAFAAEEGAAPPVPERPAFATEDVGSADRSTVADDPARYGAGDAAYREGPGREAPATYTGEEADVAGRPEYAERAEGGEQALYQEEPQRMDRPGGGGSLFTDEEPERLDRPGPQEPGLQEGVYDQEADRARRQRPADGS